ncbi:hypothetical protein [Kitasatospora terrestris]|uniref:Uncharacterized protein n=1 Tax=Kitasatospora terrestris TaxID=258051 RepID=A0ABP9DHS9_9ACTN
MPRTKPSRAHLALVQAIAEYGITATVTQVERWQQQGLMPKTSTWFECSSSRVDPEYLRRALYLAQTARAGRSIGWVGWLFWAIDDTPASARRLRTAVVASLKRPLKRAGITELPAGTSDRAFQARRDAAARMTPNRRASRRDLDQMLRDRFTEAGITLPPESPDTLPNVHHWALVESGARLLLGGAEDLGTEDLLEALEQAMPEHTGAIERLREVHRQGELAGVDLMAESPWGRGIAAMVRTVATAGDRELCHAVHTCARAVSVLQSLLQRAAQGEPEFAVLLALDAMWRRWATDGGIVPEGAPGLAAIALHTYQYLADPDWAAELDRYLGIMLILYVLPPDSSEDSCHVTAEWARFAGHASAKP